VTNQEKIAAAILEIEQFHQKYNQGCGGGCPAMEAIRGLKEVTTFLEEIGLMKKSYVLAFRWTEPEEGCAAVVANLNEEELKTVNDILRQLNKHGDGGNTLVAWDLPPRQDPTIKGGETFKKILKIIASESRYDENPDVPGEYYNIRIKELE